jgi:hypothetical protein
MVLAIRVKLTNTRTGQSIEPIAGASWLDFPVLKGDRVKIEAWVTRDGGAAPGVKLRIFRWQQLLPTMIEYGNVIKTTDSNGYAYWDYVVNQTEWTDEPNVNKIYGIEVYRG